MSRLRSGRVPQLLRKRLPALALALLLSVLGVLAVLHDGIPTARVDLNDGGVWVTNESKQLVGNLNYDSRVLSGVLHTETNQFEIGQSANVVSLHNESARSVAGIDPAMVSVGAPTSLPDDALVAHGGNSLAVLDREEGSLWVADASDPARADLSETASVASDVEGGIIAVATDGTVLAVAPSSGEFVTIQRGALTTQVTRAEAEGVDLTSKLQLTAVGNQPVALDTLANELILPDSKRVALSEEGVESGGRLQLPGPDADHVLLATPTQLVRVGMANHDVEILPAQEEGSVAGTPARPAHLNGCDYSAWSGSGAFLRTCGTDLRHQHVDTLRGASSLTFRTNRDLIVLNDTAQGSVWLPDKDMVLAANWDTVDTEVKPTDEQDESPQVSDTIADPERSTTNTPPIATDDLGIGVRPGQSVTLDVLANDSDPDGDVLTASVVKPPTFGTVWRSRGGQALRFDVPKDARGTTSFVYEASDGLAVDSATVTVRVVGNDENTAPKPRRDPGLKVGAQAEAEINILPHWFDAESDRFFLNSVSSAPGLQVSFREEGTITVRDTGHGPGAAQLTVTVVDQHGAHGQGTLTVSVQKPGNIPPRANADFYVGRVGEVVLVQPLANDQDANNDTLTLVGASAVPEGATLTPNLDTGTLSFTASLPGSYAFTYTVTDGPSQSVGIVRIDVSAADENAVPVAEDDVALLPRGGQVLVEPLSNDTEPSGGVLVVQSIDLPVNSPLQVTLIDRHLLRISSKVLLGEPTSFMYTVANGTQTAKGRVFVVPSAAQDDTLPPQLQPDRGRVRAGDIGYVDVLANDRSPAGLTLRVDPTLKHSVDPELGTPFVTGNQVRFEAGNKPGFAHVSYTVRDSNGNQSSSTVTFEVVAHEAANTAPRPRPLTAWAVSGQTTRIRVPTAGIDPDGDSVVLAGIAAPPQKGTAVLGVDWIEYTPAENQSGTDVFTYIVEDRLGKQATARVRVGVAQPAETNQPPTALPDTVLVRPGRLLTIPVLANDVDPDGDPLTVLPDGLRSNDPRLQPQAVDNGVIVHSPNEPGSYLFTYTVSDGRGGTSIGTVTLNVMKDAQPQPPIARDDVVSVADLPLDGSLLEVDVLANDSDPDGDRALLTVATQADGVSVQGNALLVRPTEERQIFTYTITDTDGLTGTAVVSVPGLTRERPTLDEKKVPITLRGGEEVALNLRDLVRVRDGRSPIIADRATVRGSVGTDGTPVVKDDHTIVFRALKDHVGQATVSVLVADGQVEDRTTVTASITIPLLVLPAVNQPPRLTPTPISIEPGGEPLAVNLSLMVDDPDDADPTTFKYSLLNAPEGVTAKLSGYHLHVSAAVGRPKGPAGGIGIGVDDGSGVVTTEMPVHITSSTRPLVQLSDALLSAAQVGTTENVDIADYSINPFPEIPLRITHTALVAGDATVDPQGTVLRITPHKTGQMTVEYTVADASGDPDRLVTGRVRLVVRDRPAPPTSVFATPTGPDSVLVVFTPGANNGAEITKYTLTEVSTGRTWSCTADASSCDITGLTPGNRYSFTVRATNAVGESDPSAPSAPVLVDVAPGRPNPPTIVAGDRAATVSWEPPTNSGSDIILYEVTLSGPVMRTLSVDGTQRSVTFNELQNGAVYSASIVAHNNSGTPSPPSAQSAPAVPFGAPSAPINLTLANSPPQVPELARIEVSWQCGASNGRPITAARVSWGSDSKEVSGDCPNSTSLDVTPGETLTVSVTVFTEGGWSPPTSGTVTARSTPLPVSSPTVRATGENGQLRITNAEVTPGNGYPADALTLEYSLDGSGWTPFSGDTNVDGLQNGVKYPLQFRQVARTVFHAVGPSVEAPAVAPFGPPSKPILRGELVEDGVLLSWEYEPRNGGEVMPLNVKLNISKGFETTASEGSRRFNVKPGQTLSAVASVCDVLGRCEQSDPVSVRRPKEGTFRAETAACDPTLPLKPPLPTPSPTPSAEPSPSPGPSESPTPEPECRVVRIITEGWDNDTRLVCRYLSDISGVQYRMAIIGNRATNSPFRTKLTKSADIEKRLTCEPS